MRFSKSLAIIALALSLSSCSKDDLPAPQQPSPSPSPSPRPSNATATPFPTPFVDESAANVVKFGVNAVGYCSSGSYTNKPCAKITVCDTGGANCKEISDILIDTGSYGLRVFKQRLGGVNLGTSNIAECMEYGDGSKQWGPVVQAKVKLKAGSAGVDVPIQVIDYQYPGMNQNCPNAEKYPDQGSTSDYAGMSGILGIGVFISDCGQYCATDSDNQVYFSCAGSNCTSTMVAEANQVQNPIAHLPSDNNGVMISLPGLPPNGALEAFGYMILGIGSRTNNTPSGATAFPVDPNFGEIKANFHDIEYRSFIDTGSNALGIPLDRQMDDILLDCGGDLAGWLCPGGTMDFTATLTGYGGGPVKVASFKVGNFASLFGNGNGNSIYSESAYSSGGNISGYFDWGLPFYFGKSVYHGFETKSSSLGSGPLWAW